MEDRPAGVFTREILRSRGVDVEGLAFVPVGASDKVRAIAQTTKERGGELPFRGVGVLDGDQKSNGASIGCLHLPGTQAPERVVFLGIIARGIDALARRLDQPSTKISDVLNSAVTLPSHHEWIRYAAKRLGVDDGLLWSSMCLAWIKECSDVEELKSFSGEIEKLRGQIFPATLDDSPLESSRQSSLPLP